MTLFTAPSTPGFVAPKHLRRERDHNKMWTRMFRVDALIEQDGKCLYCREPIRRNEATADHKTALINGGSTNRENIVAACEPCNKAKGHMSANQFINLIKSPPKGSPIEIWMAWSRRRLWLAVERTCKRIGRMVT